MDENAQISTDSYTCSHCGAPLKYHPGTDQLYCEYCSSYTNIDANDQPILEFDFKEFSGDQESLNTSLTKVISCSKCGATSSVYENLKSVICPYCGTPLIEDNIHEERLIRPAYILPFSIHDQQVETSHKQWISKLWFAPNKLKKEVLNTENTHGYYIPYWTYDANTDTDYTGQRGDHYTVTVGSGKNRRTEVRTRWSYASGNIKFFFDDVMVSASQIAPSNILNKLNGWDTYNLLNIDNRYMSGFITEKYNLNLQDGFKQAQYIMKGHIDSKIRQDIGGNVQRIQSSHTEFTDITFKLILLPIYISSYRYRNKIYHFYVNGRSGATTGERPYSAIKIILAIIACIILIGGFYLLSQQQ